MTFQTQVVKTPGFGVAGDVFDDSPRRVETFMLNSPTPTNNIFGTAFSILDNTQNPATVQSGNPGGTGIYVGIMINSKSYPLFGTAGAPLNPTLILSNGVVAQFMNLGRCIASISPLVGNGIIGDTIIFNLTTGALRSMTPGTSLPSGYGLANAIIDQFNIGSSGGLGVIRITTVP